MRYRITKVITLIAFVSTMAINVIAQASPQSSKSTPNLTASANKPAPTPEREQDGYLGPVRRVKTEVSKITSRGGKLVEGPRSTLENVAYDIKGNKSDYDYFPNAVAQLESTGREAYKYDERGNISEMVVYNPDGSIAKKEVYTYEYDAFGNWVKMTSSVAVIENAKLVYEPTEVTHRTISYYVDESTLKLLEKANQKPVVATTPPPTTPITQSPPNSAGGPSTAANSSTPASASTATKSEAPAGSSAQPNPATTASNTGSATQPTTPPTQPPESHTATTSQPVANPTSTESNKKEASAASNPNNSESEAAPAPKLLRPVSGGVLNSKALELPPPDYPNQARTMRITGTVTVEVVIDERGRVVSAKALSGPVLLQDAAVRAAKRAKFSATKLSGQAVKTVGTIHYKFSL